MTNIQQHKFLLCSALSIAQTASLCLTSFNTMRSHKIISSVSALTLAASAIYDKRYNNSNFHTTWTILGILAVASTMFSPVPNGFVYQSQAALINPLATTLTEGAVFLCASSFVLSQLNLGKHIIPAISLVMFLAGQSIYPILGLERPSLHDTFKKFGNNFLLTAFMPINVIGFAISAVKEKCYETMGRQQPPKENQISNTPAR